MELYNEDCLEGMKRIPDGAVDCILTDLPYNSTACERIAKVQTEREQNLFKGVAV